MVIKPHDEDRQSLLCVSLCSALKWCECCFCQSAEKVGMYKLAWLEASPSFKTWAVSRTMDSRQNGSIIFSIRVQTTGFDAEPAQFTVAVLWVTLMGCKGVVKFISQSAADGDVRSCMVSQA